jgi:predicted NBD/HSP70 family sugar kinase
MSAVINNGHLIRTMNDTEDAFGHMVIDYEENRNTGKGWIENYASIEAVLDRYNEQVTQSGSERTVHAENYQEIIRRAINQEKLAQQVLVEGAEILGLGLSNLVRLINPQMIVLCGPLVNQYELYYENCILAYGRNCGEHQKIQFSKGGCFGEDTIAIGSCLMVLESNIRKN